jgi:hypothetical protein
MTFEEAKTYLLEQARKHNVEADVLAEETRELSLDAFELEFRVEKAQYNQ